MNKQILISIIILASLFAVIPASVSADQWVVPGDDIQAAVDAVMANGGTVYFSPGTYNVNIVIDAPSKSCALRGSGASTILDGGSNGSVIVIVDTGAIVVNVEGFKITNGSGDDTNYSSTCGGGMYTNYANVCVSNCIFTENNADYGGGMYNEEYTSNGSYDNSGYPSYLITIDNCSFDANSADSYGGGMYNYYSHGVDMENCYFKNNSANSYAGGMYNDNSSVSMIECTFEGNEAIDDGGGMVNYVSNAIIEDSLFTGNISGENGGGIHNCNSSPVVHNCTFEYNESGNNGGGMMNGNYSAPSVTNCVFRYNKAFDAGGGMMNGGGAAPIVTSCTFTQNWAYDRGGGMYNAGSSYGATPEVYSCIFSYNEAGWRGAGMDNHGYSAPIVTNCVFVGNTVTGEVIADDSMVSGDGPLPIYSGGGGGMFNGYYCEPVVTNCTFTQNSVPHYSYYGTYDGMNGGGVKNNNDYTSTFTNCIIWGNYPNDLLCMDAAYLDIKYSDVGGGFPGIGNIDADPRFVSSSNLSLRTASPCIDTGTNTSTSEYGSVIDDILGVTRPQYASYDMGAYEFTQYVSWSPALIQPLARTQLGKVTSLWEDITEMLPEEPGEEMSGLIMKIQGYMANASQLANPIYASGQLNMAAETMQQLASLLA